MTRKELAARLGVSPNTIYRWEKAGKSPVMPQRRHDGLLIYPEIAFETLSDWMAATEPAPTAEPDIEAYYHLDDIEAAHRSNYGTSRRFCYWLTPVIEGGQMHRLVIVEEQVPGYLPITEDFVMGYEHEVRIKAADLNQRRLGVTQKEAYLIVASSMAAGEAPNRQSIDALYAWICEEPDGSEGVLNAQLGDSNVPLVGATMDRMKSLRFFAEAIRLQTGYPVRLVRFGSREDLEILP